MVFPYPLYFLYYFKKLTRYRELIGASQRVRQFEFIRCNSIWQDHPIGGSGKERCNFRLSRGNTKT